MNNSKIPSLKEMHESYGGDKTIERIKDNVNREVHNHYVNIVASLCFMGLYRNVAIIVKDRQHLDKTWDDIRMSLQQLDHMSNLRTSYSFSKSKLMVDGVSVTGHTYVIRFLLVQEAERKVEGLRTDMMWFEETADLSQYAIENIRSRNTFGIEPLTLGRFNK